MLLLRLFLLCCILFQAAFGVTNLTLTWIQGPNKGYQPATVGTVNVYAPGNTPGARDSHCFASSVSLNRLYIFGGFNNDHLNDLWAYDIALGQWAWLTGSPTSVDAIPIRGTKGTPSPGNSPGGLIGSACSMIDTSMYLFGGYGMFAANSFGATNDLWRFDLTSNIWVWLSGNGISGVCPRPVMGEESPTAVPCGKYNLGFAANVNQRLLYVFGGDGVDSSNSAGAFNDLWRYNTTNGRWTWLNGSPNKNNAGSYGSLNIAASTNVPPARTYFNMVAEATTGDLYLYGGYSSTSTVLGDMWVYTLSNAMWTWVSGSRTVNVQPVYGSVGSYAPQFTPGGRYTHVLTQRGNRLQIYLTAGEIDGSVWTKNDIWIYDIALKQWAYIGGTKGTEAKGVYGTLGQTSLSSYFGARYTHSTSCTGVGDTCFVFGGFGYDSVNVWGYLSDLWRLDISDNLEVSSTTVGSPTSSSLPSSVQLGSSSSTAQSTSSVISVVTSLNPLTGTGTSTYLTSSISRTTSISSTTIANRATSSILSVQTPTSSSLGVIPLTSTINSAATTGTLTVLTRSSVTTRVTASITIILYSSVATVTTATTSLASSEYNFFYSGTSTGVATMTSSFTSSVSSLVSSTFLTKSVSVAGVSTGSSMQSPPVSNIVTSLVFFTTATVKSSTSSLPATYTSPTDVNQPTVTSINNEIGTSVLARSSDGLATTVSHDYAIVGNITTNTNVQEIAERTVVIYNASGFTTIALILVGIVAIVVLIAAGCFVYRRRSILYPRTHKGVEEDHTESDTSTTVVGYSLTSMSSTSNLMTNYSGATVVPNSKEFSVPGFLELFAGKDFRWEQKIAEGGSGEVYIGRGFTPRLVQNNNGTLIVKILAMKESNTKARRAFNQEIAVMHYLSGQRNIAVLLGWCSLPHAIIMKYYKNGTLARFLEQRLIATKRQRLICLQDIAAGLKYMHVKGVAHCDIKPDNVLVDVDANGRFVYVLTDFGITGIYADELKMVRAFNAVNLNGVTISYASPESIRRFRARNNDVTKTDAYRSDIFSTAMMIYTLLQLSAPWT